jgi:predicted Fe-Mo cluster-binding NifX family protein
MDNDSHHFVHSTTQQKEIGIICANFIENSHHSNVVVGNIGTNNKNLC